MCPLSRLVKLMWAAPCSLVGLMLAAPLFVLGARARCSAGTVDVTLRKSLASCRRWEHALPYRAITFGHVILAVTDEELAQHRRHEQVHVRQYECWGVFFFPAYAASSAWQLLRGRNAYWDNYFEVQARALCMHPPPGEAS
ncbi:MAG: signal peptide prediction [Pseudomonadota bacterium]